jgi:hypothetical protein
MRTTIRIPDDLLERAKRKASKEGRTLTSLVEEGLTIVLAQKRFQHEPARLPVSSAAGGTLPGVDLNDAASLEELMEES